jgi:hypothetical protein
MFLLGLLDQDEERIRSVILPHRDAWVLLVGQKTSPAVLAQAKADPNFIVCRVVEEGETLTLPGNRTSVVTKHEANENKQIVEYWMDGKKTPLPLRVSRVDGHWKVDAGGIIAARLRFAKPRDDGKK